MAFLKKEPVEALLQDLRGLVQDSKAQTIAIALTAVVGGTIIAWRAYSQPKNVPPGRMGWPIIGETLEYVKDPRKFIESRRKEFGNVFMTNVFFRPTIFIGGPEATEPFIAVENKASVSSLPESLLKLHGVWSALNQEGDRLRGSRNYIIQNLSKMKFALVTMTSIRMKNAMDKVGEAPGDLKIVPFLNDISLRVMNDTFLGSEMPDDFPELFAAFNDGMLTVFAIDLPFTTFGKGMAARRKIYEHVKKILPKQSAKESGKINFLSLMLDNVDEHGKPLSEDRMINSGLLMVWGAHYEVVINAASSLYHITKHPEVLEGVFAELDSVMKAHNGQVTIASARDCIYLQACIQEQLRFAPPSGGGMRLLSEDVKVLDFTFPKGTVVSYEPRIAFNDEKVFPEPQKYDPNRFLGKIPAHAFYPGGTGSHACPGMVIGVLLIKIMLMEMLSKWRPAILEGEAGVPEMTVLPFIGIKENYCMNFTSRRRITTL